MSTHLILGIDPGAVATGFALMLAEKHQHPRLLTAETVLRVKPSTYKPTQFLPVEDDYLTHVVDTCALIVSTASLGAFDSKVTDATFHAAIEGITRPNWHMHGRAAANPEALLAAAIVLGNIQAWAREQLGTYIEIPPSGNGSAPLATYPEPLVSDAERRKPNWQNAIGKTGKLRHQRSAWDIALTAARQPLNTHTNNQGKR